MHGAVDLGNELGLPNATSKAKHAVHCHISDGGGPLRVTPTPPFGLLMIAVWTLQMCWCHDSPPTEERTRGANTWALVDLLWVATSRSAPGSARRAAASQGFPPPPRPPLRAAHRGKVFDPWKDGKPGLRPIKNFLWRLRRKSVWAKKFLRRLQQLRVYWGGGGRPPPQPHPTTPLGAKPKGEG